MNKVAIMIIAYGQNCGKILVQEVSSPLTTKQNNTDTHGPVNVGKMSARSSGYEENNGSEKILVVQQ